jgi:integrase
MAYIRRLGSGLWAATVRVPPSPERPSGRITESFRLESQAKDWADDVRSDVRAGDWLDPLRAKVPVDELWPRVREARGYLELASRRRDDSLWKNHVGPYWGRHEIGTLLRPAVQTWVNTMRAAHKGDGCPGRGCRGCKVGPHTIHASVSLLSGIAAVAVDEGRLRKNPVYDLKLPPLPKHVDRVLSGEEEQLLLTRLDDEFPGRPDARLLVELMLDSGVRWEEAAALTPDVWDRTAGRFRVAAVLEADGTIRPYPKTAAGYRWCAVSSSLWARLRPLVLATAPGEVMFRAPGVAHEEGCARKKATPPCAGCKVPALHHGNWLKRVWKRALTEPHELPPARRPPGRPGPMPRRVRRLPYLEDPQPTPHDCRHTFGTRLADAGIPVHEIAALLGHGDRRSTERYIHAGDGRFDRAQAALERARRGA